MPDKKYLALGILSVSLLTIMAGAAVSPALADILENVEGANPTLTKMVLTVPALFIIPTSYAVGRWSGEISKKKLVLFAILLYSFAGSAAYYVTDIYSLLVTRALVGVSVGITMPSITALIADFYEGPDRFRMMSFNNVAANFGGIIATFLSGLLASISWNYAFLVYLTGLPVLIVAAIFIKDPEKSSGPKLPKKPVPRCVIIRAFPSFLLFLGFYTIPTNIAVYLITNDLGGPTSAGIALSCATGSAMVLGLFASRIRAFTGNFFVYTIFLGMIISHGILGFTTSNILVYIAMVVNGYTLSMAMPYIMQKATEASEGNNVKATSMVTIFVFMGQFFSPIIFDGVSDIFSRTDAAFQYQSVFAGSVMLLILTALWRMWKRS